MRKLFAPLFLVAFLISCSSGGWQVVEGEEFYVEFPSAPKDTATKEGDFSGAKLYYEPPQNGLDSNVYYSLSMYTLPDSLSLLGDQVDEMLRTDAQIYAWSIGAMLTDSGKVVKNGNTEGREYKIFLSQNAGVVTMRKYVKGKHLYTQLVVTGNEHLENSFIPRFLNSFRFKDSAGQPVK